MNVVTLTAVCVVALSVAAAIVIRWGGGRRTPPPRPGSRRELLAHLARNATVGIVGGIAAGVLVGGLGSRLVMRALAATSGDAAEGRLTDAGELVGQITVDGTLGLVVFVGVFGGIVGGLLYVLVRSWLPQRIWLAGMVFGLILLVCVAQVDPLSPDNSDFTILRPTWLAVLLVAALFPAFGVTLAALVERLDQGWPRHPAGFAPLALLLIPQLAIPTLVVVGLALIGQRLDIHPSVRVGHVVLVVIGVAGLAWTSAGVVSILA